MPEHLVSEKALRYQEFLERECEVRHHTYEEATHQFDLLRAGDPQALAEFDRGQRDPGHRTGKLSEDPVRNAKYLTVICIAQACKTSIEAGVDAGRAYTASDLYIRKMDLLETVEEVRTLGRDAFAFYLKEIMSLEKKRTYSRPIAFCLDYIYNHLHEPVSVQDLANLTGLSESYLSTLFKKEMGKSVSEYIMSKKMEAARNMLRYTDYSYAEISAILNFSSQSHFIRTFKAHNGVTPKQYREKNYRLSGEEGPEGN